jgi:hypothetical protein
MSSPEAPFVHALWITALGCVALAVALSVLPRLGMGGWRLSELVCERRCSTWSSHCSRGSRGCWPRPGRMACLFGALLGQIAA